MNKISKTIYIVFFLLLNISTNKTFATTCAEIYHGKADGWLWKAPAMAAIGIAGLPFYGIGVGMFVMGDPARGNYISSGPKRRRVAELFEAAEVLYDLRREDGESNLGISISWSDSTIKKAEKIVAKFYKKYILKANMFTAIVEDMVVDELVKINRESAELGLCGYIFTRRNLAALFFTGGVATFDQSAETQRQIIKQKEEANVAEQFRLQQAQEIRNQNKEKYRSKSKETFLEDNFVSLASESIESSESSESSSND